MLSYIDTSQPLDESGPVKSSIEHMKRLDAAVSRIERYYRFPPDPAKPARGQPRDFAKAQNGASTIATGSSGTVTLQGWDGTSWASIGQTVTAIVPAGTSPVAASAYVTLAWLGRWEALNPCDCGPPPCSPDANLGVFALNCDGTPAAGLTVSWTGPGSYTGSCTTTAGPYSGCGVSVSTLGTYTASITGPCGTFTASIGLVKCGYSAVTICMGGGSISGTVDACGTTSGGKTPPVCTVTFNGASTTTDSTTGYFSMCWCTTATSGTLTVTPSSARYATQTFSLSGLHLCSQNVVGMSGTTTPTPSSVAPGMIDLQPASGYVYSACCFGYVMCDPVKTTLTFTSTKFGTATITYDPSLGVYSGAFPSYAYPGLAYTCPPSSVAVSVIVVPCGAPVLGGLGSTSGWSVYYIIPCPSGTPPCPVFAGSGIGFSDYGLINACWMGGEVASESITCPPTFEVTGEANLWPAAGFSGDPFTITE